MKHFPPPVFQKLTLALMFTLFFTACKKMEEVEIVQPIQANSHAHYPQTQAELEKVRLIVSAKEIIKKVYENPHAVQEVLSAIGSGRRADESILLSDLLKFSESKVYELSEIKFKGSFAAEFEKYAPKNIANTVVDSTIQDDYFSFANSNITIYFPYSENFNFDSLTQDRISLAAAQADVSEGPGEEPVRIDSSNFIYMARTINDAYAEVHPTHIIGVVNEKNLLILCPDPNDPACGGGGGGNPPTPPQPLLKRIYIGKARLIQQYDHLISFTGNGGGSEIRICHLTGYLQPVDQQITTFQDVNAVYFSRKDIRKKREKTLISIWDDNWEVDDIEQVLAVYEDDNTSESTYGGSLTTTVTIAPPTGGGPGASAVRNINFSVKIKSNDAIIKQLKMSRNSYFAFAKTNQGHGFDNVYMFNFKWPLIDWSDANDFSYTMPYQQL